ncbi:MAG: hypothetical protein AVDCRST_MAG13-3896 [uncultured Solirubrobacteraceae bacterium]|uniref:Uncharacterized protein n=1 Tax=uncultured Solirubrobacteraceae bacterium TaxID=1162706 RepID=A0A6J4TQB9_9ACTN|nr:MAG: hypothetical protein AVDCRST_MAG13-3896 [uncultured Solirubrobacteraceae bacterium]
MRWAGAAALLAAVGTVVAFVLAVRSTQDAVPTALRDCVLDGDAGIVRSAGDLGVRTRADVGDGVIRELGRMQVGDDTAVLLQGSGYRLLVLAGRKSPPLDGDLPLRVYERTNEYALVARELDPMRGVLSGCVELVAAQEA